MKVRAEGEADIRRQQAELAIKISEIDRDTKKFELEVAKKIEQIKRAVADYERAAAQAELRLARSAADLKIAAADYAVAKRKEEIALMEEAAARIATSQLAQQVGGAYTNTAREGSSSEVKALVQAANDLGVSAKDLASIISYETGGTFNPNIMGRARWQLQGSDPVRPEERKTYGVKPGMTFEEQITGPVLLTSRIGSRRWAAAHRVHRCRICTALLMAATPIDRSRQMTVTAPSLSTSGRSLRTTGANADRFMGGNVDIQRAVKEGTVEGNKETAEARKQEAATANTDAKSKVDAAVKAAEQARTEIKPTVNVDTNVDGLLEKNRQLAEQKKEVLRLEADTSGQEAKARLRAQELADLQKTQQLILATKQPILEIIEQQKVAAEMRQREAQLLMEGMLPAQVQQTLEIEKQVNLQLRKIDGAIAIFEARVGELRAQRTRQRR